jgi:uncharacterized protein (DUF1800 family)
MVDMGFRTSAAVALLAVALLSNGTGAASLPNDRSTIEHLTNRIAFGPRPGDVERIEKLGVQTYIEQQLHPERIPDPAMEDRLSELGTLELSAREIFDRFERPLLEARRIRRQQAASAPTAPTAPAAPAPAAPGARQANLLVAELAQQKLLRAIHSERQLEEVLVDFWFNHFNVDTRKGRVRFMVTEYERDAIRPHVLGRFRDLLGATAKSPAMLFYLDNWMSAAPDEGARRRTAARRMPAGQPENRRRGLNENYARELMELHTLGVDGGYTQADVTEVARAFTGWTIAGPRMGDPGFRFEPRIHDNGAKRVLGRRIDGGGIRDGEQVLDLLAAHPSTARFISTKLARRFVSDVPPAALVERMAARFTETRGDLREVMRTLLTSPELFSREAHAAKIKTPFELVVSAVRESGAPLTDARRLVRSLQDMGMPLYQCQPPTGYKDTADAWTNTGALVARINFALGLPAQLGVAPERRQALAVTLGSPEFQKR